MQFLKTLFWVLLAVFIALFASRNWFDVTLNLWGDIQVDIKLPVLMTLMFLLGFLPVFLVHRARLWTLKRRLEVERRQQALSPEPSPPVHTDDAPVL
jgi:lipopolysaccharide assembly protein A